MIARYATTSAAVRARVRREADLRYGVTADEVLDWFPTATAGAPVLVFVHGGAWRAGRKDQYSFPAEPLITAITLAELSVGPLVASTDEERAARQAHVQQTEADFDPLPFDAQAARWFGRVAASLRRAGRKTQARAYDAMIAATALANDLPVYTCNPRDFAGIDGLFRFRNDGTNERGLAVMKVTTGGGVPVAGSPKSFGA